MAKVFLGVGSNVQRELHLRLGLQALREQFNVQKISSVYESDAVGFVGEPFLNLVVQIDTRLSLTALQKALRKIESISGGERPVERYTPKTLDIDILLFDSFVGCVDGIMLPREEILFNAFVLLPLAEIAPSDVHPITKRAYSFIWDGFDKQQQKIDRVNFQWKE